MITSCAYDEKDFSKCRSRGWCLTVQSWDEDEQASVMSLFEEDHNCTYLIVGFEKAPRTGKEHMQCYVYYTNATSFKSIQKRLPGAHIEPQKAKKNVEAYYYCMEDGDWVEFGERPRQGHRSDLAVITADICNKKKTMKDIAAKYPSQWCQYNRSLKLLSDMFVTYRTQFIVYNDDTIHLIYKYPKETSHIVTDCNIEYPCQTLHLYHSGKYQYIFYPGDSEINPRLTKLIDKVLY